MRHAILEPQGLFYEQILRRVDEHADALEAAARVVQLAPPAFGTILPLVERRHIANRLALDITAGDDDRGVAAAKAVLILSAHTDGPSFYSGGVGRAVAWWIGVPDIGMGPSPTLAAAALGVSRQRVQEMQRAGRLATSAAVAQEMQARWPRTEGV